jgi:hypothetical protein
MPRAISVTTIAENGPKYSMPSAGQVMMMERDSDNYGMTIRNPNT